MKVQLVRNTEKLKIEIGDSTFFYRRILDKEKNEIAAKHTKLGLTNWEAAGMEMVKLCLIGWKNVHDEGTVIEFDKSLIDFLPGTVLKMILPLLDSIDGEREAKTTKNSPAAPKS